MGRGARALGLALVLAAVAAPAAAQGTPPASVGTTPVRSVCRGDRSLHAPATPAETAVDTALLADLRARHLTTAEHGRTCTQVERTGGDTTWSLVEWTEAAAGHATQSALAVVGCTAGACAVADVNVFARWGGGSAPATRTIDGFDTFVADGSYAVLRLGRRTRGPGGEDSSLLGVYYLDSGQVHGVDMTVGVRVLDHYDVAVAVRTDGTIAAQPATGPDAARASRLVERLASGPTVRALAALHAPIAHLDAF